MGDLGHDLRERSWGAVLTSLPVEVVGYAPPVSGTCPGVDDGRILGRCDGVVSCHGRYCSLSDRRCQPRSRADPGGRFPDLDQSQSDAERGVGEGPAARCVATESMVRSLLTSSSIWAGAAITAKTFDPAGVEVSTSPPSRCSTSNPAPCLVPRSVGERRCGLRRSARPVEEPQLPHPGRETPATVVHGCSRSVVGHSVADVREPPEDEDGPVIYGVLTGRNNWVEYRSGLPKRCAAPAGPTA
jgi:hypothetical protein